MKNFKIFKSGFYEKLKLLLVLLGVLIVGINQTWATTRTFNSGDKIYFQDASGNISDWKCLWKIDGGEIFAYFYDALEQYAWSAKAELLEGTINAANAIYVITVPQLNSEDHEFTHVIFTRGTAAGWGSEKWAQTGAKQADEGKNMFTKGTTDNDDGSWSTLSMYPAGAKLYVKPNSDWKGQGDSHDPRFAACFLGSNGQVWDDCKQVGSSDYYSVNVPSGDEYSFVIFCRMNGNSDKLDNIWGNKYNQSSDLGYSSSNNLCTITGWDGSQTRSSYSEVPSVVGSMNNWAPMADAISGGYVDIELTANTSYTFKIVDGTKWNGYGGEGTAEPSYVAADYHTFVGQTGSVTLNDNSGSNVRLLSAEAGTYRFNYNSSTRVLTVDYPTESHPSSKYIYFLDNSYTTTTVHIWGGSQSTAWGNLPELSSCNFDGKTYFYAAIGDNNEAKFADGTASPSTTTDNLDADDNMSKYYKATATAGWYDFTATLTLATNQGETTNPSPTSVTVTYGKTTNINSDVISTSPAKTGYTFGGYYTEVGGGGTQVITAAEKIPSALDGYTADGKWTKTGSSVSATLYAKWTETVMLNNQGADSGKEGTANFTATYNSSTGLTAITKPQKTGYIFSGYYTLAYGSGSQIIDADGNFNTSVTGYITEGKWTRPAGSAVTLYAYWKKASSADQYTFRYYESGKTAYNVESFVGDGNERVIENFTIPTQAEATPMFFVGYNEDFYESELGEGGTKTSSARMNWTTAYSETDGVGNGAMKLLPGSSAVGLASGAVGTLKIWTEDKHKNLSIGFLPSGYGLTYAAGTIAFNNWGGTFCETNVVTLTSEDASGNFQVKLATSDSYVACAQGTSEAASAVNGRKISGGDDIANGKKGVFQMWTDATANNFGLRFVTVHDVTFNANGHGVAPSAWTDVRYNNKISAPDAPEDVSGWAFVGWYKEAACTNKWDFDNDVVTANTTIYAKWRHTGVYTFHYGSAPATTPSNDDIMGWDVAWTGTVEPFVHDSETARTWSIANFEIPNPSTSPYFFVCWEEKFKTSYLNPRSSASKSKVYDWDDTYASSIAAIRILPGQARLSDGTNTAQGAIGTLQIDSSALSLDNLTLGFLPSGYGLTISYNDGSAKTRVIAFHKSTNDSLWETNVISDLTAAQIAGTFKVGLATATSAEDDTYVDCSVTTNENAAAVNGRKIGSFVLAASTSGRFQIFTKRGTANFGLRWVPLENHTLESGAWGGRYAHENTKWTLGRQPTKDEVVYIEHSTTIYDPDARAYSIRINKPSDSSIRLRTDDFYGGLIVETNILAKHSADGDYEATTKNDLQIATDYFGNGSLIVGNASNNTAAEYVFYTKAYKFSSSYINQYVGIPFASMPAYKLYGFNIFVYDADADDWRTPSGEGANTMQPWTAYNLIRQYAYDNWSTFYLDGTLNLPGITGDGRLKTLTCKSETNRVSNGTGTVNPEYPYFDNKGDYMFANSWTAPISIAALTASDCSDTDTSDEVEGGDLDHTIFIFNAGYIGADTVKVLGDYAGTWSAFPFGASRYMDNAVIPATQAFLVSAKVANATLTLDYKKHVYDPAVAAGEINTFPTRAPRRNTKMTNEPIRLKIVAYRDSTEADNLYIFERGDFSEGYDDGWDGGKLVDYAESTAPQLYAIHGVNKLGVDAVKEMDGTNIGFKAGSKSNEYTFVFEYNDDEPLYLYDKETNALTQISNEATYEFTTTDRAAHERFLLTRSNAPQIATGVEEIDTENVQRAQKFMHNQQIFIRRGERVYGVDGTLVK